MVAFENEKKNVRFIKLFKGKWVIFIIYAVSLFSILGILKTCKKYIEGDLNLQPWDLEGYTL